MGREASFFSFFFLSARSTWKDGHEIKGKFFLLGEFFNINVGEKGEGYCGIVVPHDEAATILLAFRIVGR